MRKPVDIPVRTLGPGSQPGELDGLEYLPMPKMESFEMPRVAATYDARALATAADVVDAVRAGLEGYRPGDAEHPCLDLCGLDADTRAALNDSLGQGEVSVIVRERGAPPDRPRVRIQETAFAGVWRVHHFDGAGALVADVLEACDMPACVRAAARDGTSDGFELRELPAGAMNSPAVLRELQHHARGFAPGVAPHVVNLTLLPNTPEDLKALDEHLGAGPVVILSRGFGNCRVASTAVRGIWRVQYFNSMQTLILDTIEVADLPEVALAGDEDFVDTVSRLRELVGWMRDDAADAAAKET
jgi:hydrogenase-1 operon protein HyaF